MKNLLYGIGFTGIIVWCLWGCEKNGTYSPIPEIHFKSLSFDSVKNDLGGIDPMVDLTFSFVDGDGDIGVRDTTTLEGRISKIHYIWYYKKADGTYETYAFKSGITENTSQIPYSEVMNKDEAQNKTLKGTIEALLIRPRKPYEPSDVDTMRIEFFIVDRAKHKSNIDYTPDFSILNIAAEVK